MPVDNAETRLLTTMWVNCQSLLGQTAIRHALAHCMIRLTHAALQYLTTDDIHELKIIAWMKDVTDNFVALFKLTQKQNEQN